MVICNLNIKYISGRPDKAHTPLFVDTDAELACTVSLERLQAVAGWRTQKTKSCSSIQLNQPIRLPGLKPGVCSGLILSGDFNPDLKIGVWRRRMYQLALSHPADALPAAGTVPFEQGLSVLITKTLDHRHYYISISDIPQAC